MGISPVQQARTLERRITALAQQRGTTVARLRRQVGFAILCETLTEATAKGIIPLFFVKGGVALELRLGLAARATRDVDIGFCVSAEQLLPVLDKALAVGFVDFRLRRRGEARILGNGVCSLEVSIEYVGRPFATVDVDVAQAVAEALIDQVEPVALHELGLVQLRPVPCLTLAEQVAQKIHALTEPLPRGYQNTRARDVLDVLLIDARFQLDANEITRMCEYVFDQRGMHQWPVSDLIFPISWGAMLSELAMQIGYDTVDAGVIEERFRSFMKRLES